MIKIARLYIKHSETESMETVLERFLKQCNLSYQDIEIKGDRHETNTHYGNWVLTPVLDNEASKRLADAMGTKLDNHDAILEESDINQFTYGEKVHIAFTGGLGFNVVEEGEVLRSNPEDGIVILKKRSRTKGWAFRPGDRVIIEKISNKNRKESIHA